MTQLAEAPPDAGDQGAEEPGGLEIWRRLYALTYSKTIGLIVILAMAVLVLAGAVIGQASAGTYDDPETAAAFLVQAQAKYGGWAVVMDWLGLFHVFTSPVFLVVVGALALSIVGCTTHRIPQLWRAWKHPKTRATDRFFTQARYHGQVAASLSDEQSLAVAQEKLRAGRWRVIANSDGQSLYADRFAWGGFGTVVAHLSFIVILAAFAVSSLTSYEELLYLPAGGDAVEVGHDTGYTAAATTFQATYDDDGRPLDYVSHVVVRAGAEIVGEQDVRVNEPLSVGGIRFHQTTYGIAADVRAEQGGQVLFSGSVPLRWRTTDQTLSVGEFRLESLGLTVQVMTAASGVTDSELAAGQAYFQIYADGNTEPMTSGVAEQGADLALGDLTLVFEREREYTGINVRSDPGAIWMWLGSILLVAGMMITFGCRQRRVWARWHDGSLQLASADKEDSGFRRQFEELLAQAQTWFGKDK
ncbi:MAG: cytochrome c biogenesis protein ResB [Propionibacteriaceae bacterium]|jgi:cytochrome c biogenesis protein|nr:cytochrome c biogenesis protein ResB [Propionibacteriaceae bacterium]